MKARTGVNALTIIEFANKYGKGCVYTLGVSTFCFAAAAEHITLGTNEENFRRLRERFYESSKASRGAGDDVTKKQIAVKGYARIDMAALEKTVIKDAAGNTVVTIKSGSGTSSVVNVNTKIDMPPDEEEQGFGILATAWVLSVVGLGLPMLYRSKAKEEGKVSKAHQNAEFSKVYQNGELPKPDQNGEVTKACQKSG